MSRPVLDQLNIVSANMRPTIEFYRLLGIDIPEPPLSKSGEPFHVNGETGGMHFGLDSDAFARVWNESWRGRADLGGRVVVGFKVETREEVDHIHARLTPGRDGR